MSAASTFYTRNIVVDFSISWHFFLAMRWFGALCYLKHIQIEQNKNDLEFHWDFQIR